MRFNSRSFPYWNVGNVIPKGGGLFLVCLFFPIKILEDLHNGVRVLVVHLTLAPLIQVVTSCWALVGWALGGKVI